MADSGKIRGAFNDEQFEAFCQELQALPAKQRTLEGIAALFKARTGIEASVMAAKSFKAGPYTRYIERINRGREAREQLCAAAGAGVHPLDAIEEAAVVELQDHLTNAETPDVEWLAKQLVKLRMSISMREESHRKQADLERKVADSEAVREQNERRTRILEERLELAQLDAAKAALAHVKEIRTVTADKSLDEAQKTERVRRILFGDKPADFRPVAPDEGRTI